MAKEIDIPEELKILNVDLCKEIIVIGNKGYEIFPLPEGKLETIIMDVESVSQKMFCPDRKCPQCGKVIKWAGPRKIYDCPDDQSPLEDMSLSPNAAILSSGKLPEWLSVLTGLTKVEIQDRATFAQLKHCAGVFWKQNFDEDTLPPESQKNFKRLLAKLQGEEKDQTKIEAPAAKTENPQP